MKAFTYKLKTKVQDIFKLVNKSSEELAALNLEGQLLLDVYEDYLKRQAELQRTAEMVSTNLMAFSKVHSVRYRVKDPVHLLKKIIRKKIESPERVIDVTNYLEEVTDLVGMRVLHLYKESWVSIGRSITDSWELKEKPIAYIRTGDSEYYTKQFEEQGCEVKEHKAGYRSLHYIIETKPNKQKFFVEIQVRTIFEEGWSEIDHSIRYPNNTENTLINSFLQILNRLSGSADELGTYIRKLYLDLNKIERTYEISLKERDDKIQELEKTIDNLSIKGPEKQQINNQIKDLISTQRKFATFGLDALINPPGMVAAMEAARAMRIPSEAVANLGEAAARLARPSNISPGAGKERRTIVKTKKDSKSTDGVGSDES